MANSSTKNRHLSLDDRIEIQSCLNCGNSFKAIAKRIGKDPTTISKEVKRNILVKPTSAVRKDKDGQTIVAICPNLLKPPFVCNACRKKNTQCVFDKYFYYAKYAQTKYVEKLHSSREGIPLNKESFYEDDRVISEGIKKGQHLYHIIHSNRLKVSERTVYRHLHKGYYSVGISDAPRIVKFKPRKKSRAEYVPKGIKIGRSYADYLAFIAEHSDMTVTEMDTVIGTPGGKIILTMILTDCSFMFGRLLPDKTSASVSNEIKKIRETMAENGFDFDDIFPVILTDNGGEFSDVYTIESGKTKVFFCDPVHPCQKPHVEKNHTLFRDIVPKGSSFDDFSQDTVDLIFSHVNGVCRKQLKGKTPYEMMTFLYGERLANCLGIQKILPEEVIQSPKLLRKKKA